MKRLLTACLLGPIALTAAFAVSAQTAVSVESEAQVDAQAREESPAAGTEQLDQDADAATQADAELVAQIDADRQCIRHTGSHIRTRDPDAENCVGANGSVYSREELRSTGRVDLADALRTLDPAIN